MAHLQEMRNQINETQITIILNRAEVIQNLRHSRRCVNEPGNIQRNHKSDLS